MSKIIVFLIILVQSFSAFAQNDRYVVFFTDKNQSDFSINEPIQFLSERAIERREKQNIVITESDLPVNNSYVQQVAALGVETYYTSKWMNCVLVETAESDVPFIESLDFVERVEFVAPGDVLEPFEDNVPPLGPFFSPAESDISSDSIENVTSKLYA